MIVLKINNIIIEIVKSSKILKYDNVWEGIMYTKNALAIFVIAASIVIATVSMTNPVAADNARKGLDKADENVHDNAPGGLLGDIDKRFHEGLCQGEHSTTIVDKELGGCGAIPEPGGKNP